MSSGQLFILGSLVSLLYSLWGVVCHSLAVISI